jgi:hypothetical protein
MFPKKQNVKRQIVLGRTLLNEAKLGKNMEITIQDGAILILPEVKKKGWQLLAKLGEDASEGMLEEPARRHDDYLYGKKQ